MKIHYLIVILLASLVQPVWAATEEDALQKSQALAAEKKFDEALAVLRKAAEQHPKDMDITLAIARVLSWQGNYNEAEKLLAKLSARDNANPDVMLLRANLAYYRGDYPIAKKLYQDILAAYPHYKDAADGLEEVKKAENAPENKYRWQLDMGHERSNFSRINQPAWNQDFMQITHFLEGGKTALHATVTRYDQFSNIDTGYEAGVDHRFTDYLNGYLYGFTSPAANFEPVWRLSSGGVVRVLDGKDNHLPLWFTLDGRIQRGDIWSMNPGLRLEFHDGWAVSTHYTIVKPGSDPYIDGKDIRLDGVITNTLRFYAGYAHAPETENNITVRTKTCFGGLAWDATDQITLHLGYTRDDREKSYVREAVNASISYRF